ncbi:hypothetical protein D3C81_1736330 [compost metagenome]
MTASAANNRSSSKTRRGALSRNMQASASSAPATPQALMMASVSQYCSTVSWMPLRRKLPRSIGVASHSDSQSDTIGKSWPWPNK